MWMIGEIHPIYGEVVACLCIGEPYRMFNDGGVISLIPLDALSKEGREA